MKSKSFSLIFTGILNLVLHTFLDDEYKYEAFFDERIYDGSGIIRFSLAYLKIPIFFSRHIQISIQKTKLKNI